MPTYEVVEANSLAHFNSKVDLLQIHRNYIDCLGNHHKIVSFKISNDCAVDLLYANKISSDTFKINVKFVKLDFSLLIEKKNRYYYEHCLFFKNTEKRDDNVVRKDIQTFGISIGDLIKHFYQNNREKEVQFVEDKAENEKLNKLLKKALSVDTTTASIHNVLGTYNHHRKTIYLWETLDKYIEKGKTDFSGFCNKIVYMSGKTIPDLLTKDTKTNKYTLDNKKCEALFNGLTDKIIIYKLLRYHLYNEDPDEGFQTKIHYFEKPILVPEILKYFYETYNDNLYMDVYNKVLKKLNGNEQQVLNEKYKPAIFKCMEIIPREYPIFAFRNISLKQWTHNDIHDLDQHHRDYMRSVKSQKYKYKSSISNKVIPVEQRMHYFYPRDDEKYKYDGKFSSFKWDMENQIKEALADY